MLMSTLPAGVTDKCSRCGNEAAVIFIIGYGGVGSDLALCVEDALQLSRILLEDLCEVIAGDRHG